MPCAFLGGHVLVGKRQVDVLGDGEVVEQVVALEDHADALSRKVGALLAVQRVSGRLAKPVLALPAIVEQSQNIEQRRLSRSRRAHDGEEFAFADGEADAAQHPFLGVAVLVTSFNVLEFDHDSQLTPISHPDISGRFTPCAMPA